MQLYKGDNLGLFVLQFVFTITGANSHRLQGAGYMMLLEICGNNRECLVFVMGMSRIVCHQNDNDDPLHAWEMKHKGNAKEILNSFPCSRQIELMVTKGRQLMCDIDLPREDRRSNIKREIPTSLERRWPNATTDAKSRQEMTKTTVWKGTKILLLVRRKQLHQIDIETKKRTMVTLRQCATAIAYSKSKAKILLASCGTELVYTDLKSFHKVIKENIRGRTIQLVIDEYERLIFARTRKGILQMDMDGQNSNLLYRISRHVVAIAIVANTNTKEILLLQGSRLTSISYKGKVSFLSRDVINYLRYIVVDPIKNKIYAISGYSLYSLSDDYSISRFITKFEHRPVKIVYNDKRLIVRVSPKSFLVLDLETNIIKHDIKFEDGPVQDYCII